MSEENQTTFPEVWRQLVHPRRGGMAFVSPWGELDSPAPAHSARQLLEGTAGFSELIEHPESAPGVAELIRDPEGGVAADGARLVVAAEYGTHGRGTDFSFDLINELVRTQSLAHAAAAFVASAAYFVPRNNHHRRGKPLVGYNHIEDNDEFGAHFQRLEPARYLRSLLVAAPTQAYESAVETVRPLRQTRFGQRVLASYLFPDQRDWVDADHTDIPAGYGGPAGLLLYSAATTGQLTRWRALRLEDVVTAYDAVGDAVVPVLAQWLSALRWFEDGRKDVLEVLARIPTDQAVEYLFKTMDIPDVSNSLREVGKRFPRRMARVLASLRDGDQADALLRRHVKAHPEVAEAGLFNRLPEAGPETAPPLLNSPPWTRKPPVRLVVRLPEGSEIPKMFWEPGEREAALNGWRARISDVSAHLQAAASGNAPLEFYLEGAPEVVRPFLANWKSETPRYFYFHEPAVLAARYELDALPPILRLARRKPAVGAALLLPYRAPEAAELMAEWLTRSRQYRPIAQQWFSRHGVDAIAYLIPTALGGATASSRTATVALHRLDGADVRAAAELLGCLPAVEEMLDRDPLDLVPARIPSAPKWADPDVLPPVLVADGTRSLSNTHIRNLLRIIAMSDLEDPYDGLRQIAEHCDSASLAQFVWGLFRLWELEGRPSKDVWALNALGYFGDDSVADRLAPYVRAWPSEAASPRAKRGADVLAAIGSDRALQHLSALARNAKSIPLRSHSAQALDRVAAERGLLPEQLEDLLAPDLGLDGEPVVYGGLSYTADLAPGGQLMLRDESQILVATLPKAANDEQNAVVAEWNSRRRKSKQLIADQLARLTEAMVVQRTWSVAHFRSQVLGHPLLGRLARALVWSSDGNTAVVDALGDLVGVDGGLIPLGPWVRLAHPAVDALGIWLPWLGSRGSAQPFWQIERDVHLDEDPSLWWGRRVEAAKLHGLVRHGWVWGPTEAQAIRHQLFRPFGAAGRVVLTIEPGVSAVSDARNEPPQLISGATFESAETEFGVFGDLSPVTRSELVRSLRLLD